MRKGDGKRVTVATILTAELRYKARGPMSALFAARTDFDLTTVKEGIESLTGRALHRQPHGTAQSLGSLNDSSCFSNV